MKFFYMTSGTGNPPHPKAEWDAVNREWVVDLTLEDIVELAKTPYRDFVRIFAPQGDGELPLIDTYSYAENNDD